MSKKYMYLFGVALLALSGVGMSAQSAQAKGTHQVRRTNVTRNYQRYFVNAPLSISSHAHTISGTATRGSYVELQNGRQTVSSTHANRRTGRYVLGVPKLFKAGTNLRVVAKKGYEHPFRDVIVKTPANQRAAVRTNRSVNHRARRKATKKNYRRTKNVKRTRKSVKRQVNHKRATKRNVKKVTNRTKKPRRSRKSRNNQVTIQDPNGNWQARQSKHYTQKWNLSQARGLNETLYHNGHYAKKLVTDAPYHVKMNLKNNVWTVSYQPHHAKSKTMYLHFMNNNHFKLTNARGRRASLSFVRF